MPFNGDRTAIDDRAARVHREDASILDNEIAGLRSSHC
jgi:hypothetical protein